MSFVQFVQRRDVWVPAVPAFVLLWLACAKPNQYDPLLLDAGADTVDRSASEPEASSRSDAGTDNTGGAVTPDAGSEVIDTTPADGALDLVSDLAPVTTDVAVDAAAEAPPPPVAWEVVTVGMGGAPANGNSRGACLSADGRYIVFLSDASNLVPDDTNGLTDVFRFDRVSNTTERVNVSTEGAQADKTWRDLPSVSGDGRYVVFVSSATNLVAGDTNGTEDVFLRDMESKRTTRVSVSSTGAQLANQSASGAISGDGTQILFVTTSPSVVPNLQLMGAEGFLFNRTSGTVSRVTQGTESLFNVWISHNANTVASLSHKPPEAAGTYYLHDTASRQTKAVGQLGADVGSGVRASLSDDGRYFAFDTFSDPVTGQSLPHGVYVLDRSEMKLTRISAMIGEGDPDAYGAYISGDGQLIAFSSRLQPRILARATGVLTRLPIPGGTGFVADLSRDGRFVAITSSATALPGSSNNVTNLYVAPTGR